MKNYISLGTSTFLIAVALTLGVACDDPAESTVGSACESSVDCDRGQVCNSQGVCEVVGEDASLDTTAGDTAVSDTSTGDDANGDTTKNDTTATDTTQGDTSTTDTTATDTTMTDMADGCSDADDDGVTDCDGDCDDMDPLTYPGATEVCGDDIDNTCGDNPDAGCGDGLGGPNEPSGYSALVGRRFNSFATETSGRGMGDFPFKTGGSEGWDDIERRDSANLGLASAPNEPGNPPIRESFGQSALRITYPVGLDNNNGPGIAQTQPIQNTHGNYTELYVLTTIYLGPEYWVGSVTNKLYFHRTSNSRSGGEPFLALDNNGSGAFRIGVNFQGTPDNGLGFFWADSGTPASIQKETWYVVETQLVLDSSVGAGDGIFRLWVDGELAVERTDVQYLTDQAYWSTLHVSPTFGGSSQPNDTEFWWQMGHAYVSGR